MLKIAIVEDEKDFQDTLKKYLDSYAAEKHRVFETRFFANGLNIVEENSRFDIVFMDIKMPQMDGMSAAKRLREKDPGFVLIFITNLANLAVKGYEVDALDFLIKPLSYFEFSVKFEKALRVLERKTKAFAMFTDKTGSVHRLALDDIRYVDVKGHDVTIHATTGDIAVYGTLKGVTAELANPAFYQINKYYLVNLAYITAFDPKTSSVYLGEDGLQVSRGKKKALMDNLTLFTEKGGE